PVSTFYPINKAYILTSNREFELAENLLLDILKNNNDSHALWLLGNNYANMGKYDMAIETLRKRPDGSTNNWIMGYCYGKTGQLDKAYEVIDYLIEKNKESYVPPYMIGIVYMGVGKTEEAMDWFEKGLADGPIFSYITEVRGRTKLSELEDNPRFKEILKKFGIER
ncbi:MAG: tetratricopeptide repeat protein, partial [Cyclobacteriaceae bacterium]|nr:tetratricopeptide repeat protein [Cyclobacteriaceae bacterium]